MLLPHLLCAEATETADTFSLFYLELLFCRSGHFQFFSSYVHHENVFLCLEYEICMKYSYIQYLISGWWIYFGMFRKPLDVVPSWRKWVLVSMPLIVILISSAFLTLSVHVFHEKNNFLSYPLLLQLPWCPTQTYRTKPPWTEPSETESQKKSSLLWCFEWEWLHRLRVWMCWELLEWVAFLEEEYH